MPQWYYGSSAGQTGPVEEAELRALIASGGVGPETLVWRDGMKEWQRLDSVPELRAGGVAVPYAPYPQAYFPQVAPTSGLAIASMICGIIGYFTCHFVGILGIPAVICGHLALSQIKACPVPMGGRGMAITGLVLGYLGIGVSLASLLMIVISISQLRI